MKAYLDSAGIREAKNSPLFRVMPYGKVTHNGLHEMNSLAMIKRRTKNAGLPDWVGNHVCRATGITRFLETGGTLEEAANLANHANVRTTRIYDKGDRIIHRTSVEWIVY